MKLLRRPRPPVTTVRADELIPGDRLAEVSALSGGETVTHADQGHGDAIVFVTTAEQPGWVWPLAPATSVAIYEPEEVHN
ncbi:hypothetical protein [Amycolatopsis sp. ATCC 39116]|uniref:hypothetical protein n=1 Tax=Amycolatopsis sp. (strain ATCC 39116 / 75iv2) TaxID=385957 RepID=UPI0002625918|nr:hypothetical protein [Amycolatopsis sp. ATCC 39116]